MAHSTLAPRGRRRANRRRLGLLSTTQNNDDDPSQGKIEALVEIICRAGDGPAAALFVLMGTLEYSTHPKTLANTAKHLAFTHCSESNVYGIVDAQLSLVDKVNRLRRATIIGGLIRRRNASEIRTDLFWTA